jgi:hypothetical protein
VEDFFFGSLNKVGGIVYRLDTWRRRPYGLQYNLNRRYNGIVSTDAIGHRWTECENQI